MKTYFARYPKKIEFSTYPDPIDGLPEADLEPADVILITHHHKDHCKQVTVNRLTTAENLVLAPKRCMKELGNIMKVIGPGDTLCYGAIQITVIDAYNTPQGASTRKVHRKGEGVGYLVQIQEKTIFHAGDSDLIPEMKTLGMIDIALLPIGGRFIMDLQEAVEAALVLHPKIVIPMHQKEADPLEFKAQVEVRSYVQVILLKIGEVLSLS